jgi:ABC-type phosphate transport system substrate-binding protein
MNTRKPFALSAPPLRAALLLTLLAMLIGSAARAGEENDRVLIMVNARNPSQTLQAGDVKKLFLGQTAFWHGVVPVKVAVRPDSSEAARRFYGLLGMTPQAFRKHWDEVQLAGRGVAPQTIGSAQELAQAIGQIPGGIGFVLASETWTLQNRTVKIIEVR